MHRIQREGHLKRDRRSIEALPDIPVRKSWL
jgi:hypothetical protein